MDWLLLLLHVQLLSLSNPTIFKYRSLGIWRDIACTFVWYCNVSCLRDDRWFMMREQQYKHRYTTLPKNSSWQTATISFVGDGKGGHFRFHAKNSRILKKERKLSLYLKRKLFFYLKRKLFFYLKKIILFKNKNIFLFKKTIIFLFKKKNIFLFKQKIIFLFQKNYLPI